MPKTVEPGIQDLFRELGERTRLLSTRPNIHGYKPHPKQKIFHSAPQKDRLYIGGNRAGKTVGGIAEDIWHATGRHPYRATPEPPTRGRIVATDFINGIEKIIIPELGRWLPPSELINGSWEDSYARLTRILTLANGSTIDLMSYEQDLQKFSGTSRHWTHFDEEPPADIFTECKMRLLDVNGAWWMTLTPVEGMEWMYDEIYLNGKTNPEANIAVIEVDITENPYIGRNEIESFMVGLSEDDKNARIHGKFIRRGGLVFPNFDPAVNVIDPVHPSSFVRNRWFSSWDFGLNNPTAVNWHCVFPDGSVVTFDEHYEESQTHEYHARVFKARCDSMGRKPDVNVGDPSMAQRDKQTGLSLQLAYMQLGVPIVPPQTHDVRAGLSKMRAYLDPIGIQPARWRITRNCPNLIAEMRKYRWETWSSKVVSTQNNKQEKPHKKDDHAIDGSRYFFSFMPDLARRPEGNTPREDQMVLDHRTYTIDDRTGMSGTWDQMIGLNRTDWKSADQTEYDEYLGGLW